MSNAGVRGEVRVVHVCIDSKKKLKVDFFFVEGST